MNFEQEKMVSKRPRVEEESKKEKEDSNNKMEENENKTNKIRIHNLVHHESEIEKEVESGNEVERFGKVKSSTSQFLSYYSSLRDYEKKSLMEEMIKISENSVKKHVYSLLVPAMSRDFISQLPSISFLSFFLSFKNSKT